VADADVRDDGEADPEGVLDVEGALDLDGVLGDEVEAAAEGERELEGELAGEAGAAGEGDAVCRADAETELIGALLGLLEDVEGDGLTDPEGDGDGVGDVDGDGLGEGVAEAGIAWHLELVSAEAAALDVISVRLGVLACAVVGRLVSTPSVRGPPASKPIAAIRTYPKRISLVRLRCSPG
jgi:hypothetical protein